MLRRHALASLTVTATLPLLAPPGAHGQPARAATASASGAHEHGGPPILTISTNNTPADRKALQLLGDEALRRAGLVLRLVSLPSQRSLFAANAGEVDGEGLRVAGLEASYPDLVRVPERFISISFVAFTRDPKLVLDQGFASLKPLRVAHINGWKLFEAQAAVARVVYKVDQAEQLFRMLEADRVDVALYTLADGLALVNAMRLGQVRALQPALAEADMFLYLHQRHQAWVPKIAQALRDMRADGTHARLVAAAAAP